MGSKLYFRNFSAILRNSPATLPHIGRMLPAMTDGQAAALSQAQ